MGGINYKSWADKMNDATKVDRMLSAAALDTIWFYDKLKSLVQPANASNESVPEFLTTTEISKHFAIFQKFSCMRNMPQCSHDQADTTACVLACDDVDIAIANFLNECNVAAGTFEIECGTLGYVRDCDGTNSAQAGDFPRLCSAFQNQAEGSAVVPSGHCQ